MRTSETFVLGMITGAVVAWFWGRDIQGYVGEQTRGVRARAAEGMRAVDEKAGQVLDRGGHSLGRAEGFVRDRRRLTRHQHPERHDWRVHRPDARRRHVACLIGLVQGSSPVRYPRWTT